MTMREAGMPATYASPGKAPVVIALALTSLCLACSGWAEPLSADDQENGGPPRPLWELGLFNGVARIPHYRGSDEYSTYAVPFPYFLYRGKVFRSGRDGVKGVFLKHDQLQIDLSVSGSPPVPQDNKAREDMHDIGAILSVGPSLKYDFLDNESPDRLQARGAILGSIAFDVHDRMQASSEGYRATLDLSYRNRTLFEGAGLSFGGRCAIDYFSEAYSDYIYGVSEDEALATRPQYDADGGYAGFSISTYVTKKLSDRFSVAAFFAWVDLDHAVFEDSPVVRTDNNLVAGCALTWKIAESKRQAFTSQGK
jgi:outer membrane protein